MRLGMGNNRFAEELDENLIRLSLNGNNEALEALVLRYKDRIYNIAIRLAGNAYEADDVTQEIIIKLITKLSTFKFQSSFSTWLYRVTINHFLTLKKKGKETYFTSFEKHREFFENLGSRELAEHDCPNREMVIEETKTECLLGMLLCLDREQRIIFVLGGIFGVNGKTGAEILGISEENYRMKLSRARRNLKNYMDDNCGLINTDNLCRCSKKTKAAVAAGYIDPGNLQFTGRHLKSVKDFVTQDRIATEDLLEWRYGKIFREQPYKIFEESKIARLINGLPENSAI
jgi:RNA polymerase sigma factor (sigma-70 family)